jgi:hypothetical protein
LSAVLLHASFCSAQAQSVRIGQVQVGFPDGTADRFKVGSWLPVSVELLVEGSAGPFSGTLTVEADDCDGLATRFPVPALERSGWILAYTKTGTLDSKIRLTVAGTAGTVPVRVVEVYDPQEHATVLASGRKLLPALRPAQTLLLELGPGVGLDPARQAPPLAPPSDGGGGSWSLARQTAVDRLPDQWFGYEGVDVVLLPTGDANRDLLERLRATGKEAALAQWVEMGGHLVVSVGKNHALLNGAGALRDLLPAEVVSYQASPERLDQLAEIVRDRGSKIQTDLVTPRVHLKLRPSARTVLHSRPGLGDRADPVVVQAPHGLGRVTLLAFDTGEGPFAAWEGRHDFWMILLDLRAAASPDGPAPAARFQAEERDLALPFFGYLEHFPEVPSFPFGWFAVLMLAYLLLVGPVEYFLLRRFAGRLEWTWVTLPLLVTAALAGIYGLALHLKGDRLRIHKVDVVEIDAERRQAYGSTWFSLFSPEAAKYDLALEPGAPEASPRGVVLSWMGRPGSGLRGLERSQRFEAFGPTAAEGYAYAVHEEAEAGSFAQVRLEQVPVPIWSARTFTARWQLALPANPVPSSLRQRPRSLSLDRGSTLTWNLPFPLRQAQLLHYDRGWRLGDLAPGQTVTLPAADERLADVLDQPPWPLRLLFHQALEARQDTRSDYLDYLDQSWRVDYRGKDLRQESLRVVYTTQALLLGWLEEDEEGDAAELNRNIRLGSRLQLPGLPATARLRQRTLVRVFLPVQES